MQRCKHHGEFDCGWCAKWRDTYSYFKKRKCKKLTIYCVRLTHYRTGEQFYKVGLTSTTVQSRFERDEERFKIEILKTKELPLYEAVALETKTLYDKFKAGLKYYPKARISGHTECYKARKG
jgi:hypothetical protein